MRTSFRIFGTAAAVLPMLLATVAAAQETPAPAPTAQAMEIQRLTALAALTEVQNKLLDTQNARFKAQVDALGLHKTEGKTTLAADAGKMETWMLAAGTLGAAAAEINQKNTAGPIVLLDSDDTLDLGRGSVLRHQIEAMLVAFEAAATPTCARTQSNGGAALVAPVAVIGAVLSLLRTDTEISAISVDGAEGALINAIAGTAKDKYVIPAAIIRVRDDGPTATKLTNLITTRETIPACKAAISAAASTTEQKTAAAEQIAKIDGVSARIDTYLAAVGTRSEGKTSDLDIALLGDTIIARHPNARVMRVRLEKAGGTLLKRSNLFTMLGAPAVGITGGAVISWQVTDPETGMVDGGGVLVCRTKLTNLRDIHKGRVNASACGVEVHDPAQGEPIQ
ncbi:hypothetical protein [Sphingomonas sp. CFBP 8764]|uniref:hypothetical protein n=1 Tax=Sphingomonas sp. CFBP 8764 TaxID=2775275 RepID=UPI00177FBE97|nr:hypothetical protein [Sphingomonas sp. CFBP 8764]MBD8552000.1 hypothetical protein [Sphingomonas sp. CFBP 8764]